MEYTRRRQQHMREKVDGFRRLKAAWQEGAYQDWGQHKSKADKVVIKRFNAPHGRRRHNMHEWGPWRCYACKFQVKDSNKVTHLDEKTVWGVYAIDGNYDGCDARNLCCNNYAVRSFFNVAIDNVKQPLRNQFQAARHKALVLLGESFACPAGYLQQGYLGADIDGCGLESCDGRAKVDTIKECKDRCDTHNDCVSFNYAPPNAKDHAKVCTLYDKTQPTHIYKDELVFCARKHYKLAKSGAYCQKRWWLGNPAHGIPNLDACAVAAAKNRHCHGKYFHFHDYGSGGGGNCYCTLDLCPEAGTSGFDTDKFASWEERAWNAVVSLAAAVAAASAAAGTVSLAFGSGLHVELLQAVAGVAVSWVFARLSLHLGSQTWLMAGARAAGFLVGFICAPAVALILFPVRELYEAFIAAEPFLPPGVLRKASAELLVTTMQSQVALGYVGVYVLRQSQARKNVLLTVDKSRAAGERTLCSAFVKHAVWFMAFVAIPYLLQRILVENVSDFTFARFSNMVETGLRIGSLFPMVSDPNGPRTSLLSAVASSNLTVDAYAGEIGSIVRTGHSIVERVLFSVPKLALLPGILVSQPWLLLLVLPGNMGLDFVRAKAFAHLTSRMEKLNREIQELASRRSNMEQHDTESAEILQRVGASSFAEVQWRLRARHLQDKFLRLQALRLFRGFVDTLYIQDFVAPGIEIAIAYLLQFQQITAVDIWVYTRVVEDAQNTLLVRFRREAALATVKTNVERLQALSKRLKNRTRLRCKVDSGASAMQVRNLSYSRGSQLQVRLGSVSLEAGKAYAVTGPAWAPVLRTILRRQLVAVPEERFHELVAAEVSFLATAKSSLNKTDKEASEEGKEGGSGRGFAGRDERALGGMNQEIVTWCDTRDMVPFIQTEIPKRFALRIRLIETLEGWQVAVIFVVGVAGVVLAVVVVLVVVAWTPTLAW
ncbi:hypothetical protein AK812_SmicGene33967 [Symbiodinium microadriaticum]|uniref:Apple domain-containing protein n=1 Tax=Symbiodinium microadriaticum TaxID=2951 RepID=A0A1Q9CQ66_SYMMI|nr:hypothetical protein AK812_SmicGene33967 [Symbiodinium microadriaticum]